MILQVLARRADLSACIGLLSLVPFLLVNTIAMRQIEPFISFLRPDGHTSAIEIVLLFLVLLVFPFGGAYISLLPILRSVYGKRKFYLVNAAIACVLVLSSLTIASLLGIELFRCEVLHIPNCD